MLWSIELLRKGDIEMAQELTPAEKAGKNLKNLIKSSEYKTQERFAYEAMHVNPVTIRRWIAHGIKDVNTIVEIAEIFDVDFKELFK